MNYLLDTNICIYIIKKSPEIVLKKLELINSFHSKSEIYLSSVTIAELHYGIQKSKRIAENTEALKDFLTPFKVLDFSLPSAEIFGAVRSKLEGAGKIIGPYDLQIASIAMANDLTLVTNNTKEFERVDGLKLENWAKEI